MTPASYGLRGWLEILEKEMPFYSGFQLPSPAHGQEIIENWYISFNSSPPTATYMRQWNGSALVQIMAGHLFSVPSYYLNQCWVIVNWSLGNNLQWNFNQNTKLFIHKNAFENIVCEIAVILSIGKWVKFLKTIQHMSIESNVSDYSLLCKVKYVCHFWE